MSFFPTVSLVLAAVLSLLAAVDGALHAHKHHHDDKVIARATTSPLSLAATASTIASYSSFLHGSATPCSGSACTTAVPTSSDVCPAGNGTAWTEFATAQNYTVICDVDFLAQNIYPFVLAGSFEGCMAQCESFNAKTRDGDIHCEGFVFAPERIQYADDCYLKSSLDRPASATISLIGATMVASFPSPATPLGKQSDTSTCLSLNITSQY